MILRDRKRDLLKNLDFINKSYLNLLLLKQLEQDVINNSSYENLHELSENERRIVEDINATLKYIVPDLIYFREDRLIKEKVKELDNLQTSVIKKNIQLKRNLENLMGATKKTIENLEAFPPERTYTIPKIVNLRA